MPRKINFTSKQIEDILNRYNRSESIRKISGEYNVDPNVIKRVLKENFVEIRGVQYNGNPYYFDDSFFEVIDTEVKAYWLGFIFADGYITKNKVFGVKLSRKDTEHLYALKAALKSEHRVYQYENKQDNFSGKGYKFSKLQITNKKLVRDLQMLGVTSNKTTECKFPDIPEEMERHFIRGYFDGDGSVYVSKGRTNTCKEYVRPAMSILGTECMVRAILRKICPGSNAQVYFRKGSYYLTLAGYGRLREIRDYLYEDSTICLGRKKIKFYELTR